MNKEKHFIAVVTRRKKLPASRFQEFWLIYNHIWQINGSLRHVATLKGSLIEQMSKRNEL